MLNTGFIVIVSLFCLNGRILGGPVNERNPKLISDYLSEISASCTNRFLASEIAKNLESCSIKPPPSDKEESANDKQLLCIMYYDINLQLCRTKLNESDFAANIPEVSVKDLCTESAHWTVTQIPWYPLYQTTMNGLLTDTIFCSSLCHDPSNLHHANHVCKLYKVGYDLLHQTKPITSTAQNKDDTKKHVIEESESKEDGKPQTIHRDTAPADIIARKALEDAYHSRNAIENPPTEIKPQNKPNSEITKTNGAQPSSLGNHASASESIKADEQETVNKVNKFRAKNQINQLPHSELAQPVISTSSNLKPESNPIVAQPESIPQAEEDREPNLPQDVPQGGIDDVGIKPAEDKGKKLKDNNVVAPASDPVGEAQQGEMDNWGEAGGINEGEAALEDPGLADGEADGEFEEPLKPAGKPEKLPDSMQKATFPNQPEFPSEDEDHFFSFFITGIVLVTLFYVLYHNKSKVTKVVLGLIVEGRQPGRRRKSRGHAYKRLDTLEQAMSSNTTAPPAKIIY